MTSGYISLSPSCFLTIFMMWGQLHNSVFELRTEIKCNHKSRKSLSLTFKNYYVCNSSETSLTSCIENCLLHLSFLDISIKKKKVMSNHHIKLQHSGEVKKKKQIFDLRRKKKHQSNVYSEQKTITVMVPEFSCAGPPLSLSLIALSLPPLCPC